MALRPVAVGADKTRLGHARLAFTMARNRSGMVRGLNPDEWKPVSFNPIPGTWEFRGPGDIKLYIGADGLSAWQEAQA